MTALREGVSPDTFEQIYKDHQTFQDKNGSAIRGGNARHGANICKRLACGFNVGKRINFRSFSPQPGRG